MIISLRPLHRLTAVTLLFAALLALPAPAAPTATASDAESTRFEARLKESQTVEPNDPPRAVALAREALALARSRQNRTDELRACARLGEALRVASQYAEARAVVDAALALPITDADRDARALVLYTSGQIWWNRGDYPTAERCFVEVQREAESLGDRRLLIRVLNSRGTVTRHQNDLPQAAAHFRAALALAEAAGEKELRSQILNNLAVLLTSERRFDEARPLLEENLRLHTASGNRRGQANALVNLGSIEDTAGRPASALDLYLRALALRRELGIPRHIANSLYAVANCLTKLGRPDEALAHLREAVPLAEQLGSHELWANVHLNFAAAHAARGEFREALEAQRLAEKENTLVAGEKTASTVAELRERFDAEKRSREILELRDAQKLKDADLALRAAELRRARLQRYGLAALLALGAIAAAAIIGRQRALARAERRILAETRRARDAAEEAHALKSKLLDLASHDLKAPLVGVMMTADTIADETGDRPAVADRARALRAESQRMFQLVQDLLDSSALEAGHLALARAPLDLAALAREIAADFAPRFARKQQRLDLAADAACPVDADAARLRQVIDNLLDNASKFSPAGTTVHLSVAPAGAAVRLTVRDEGPGLTAEDRQNLFQRFRRLSAVPTAGEPSTGLGLALTHDLVAQHGGRLWAESTPGAGATFIADLPSSAAAQSPAAA